MQLLDTNRDEIGQAYRGLAYARPDFLLNREGLNFFRRLFSLKGQAIGHSKSLLGLFK